jgi:hypothetical protein
MKKFIIFVIISSLAPVALAKGRCTDDRAKFCKQVEDSGGDVWACLKQHADQLSETCKAKLAERDQQGQADSKTSEPQPQ